MKDIKERYFKDDDSPMFLSPNAERDYRKSKEEYKKHRKEFVVFYNTLKEGLNRLDEIKQMGRDKTEE